MKLTPVRDFDDIHDGACGARAVGDDYDIDRWLTLDLHDAGELCRKYQVSGITELTSEVVRDLADRRRLSNASRRMQRRHATILCFAEEPTNEVMWATYADNHGGICLEFSTEFDPFDRCVPVVYLNRPTDLDHVDSTPLTGVDPMLCAKSLEWSFQKEWRLVDPAGATKFQGFSPRSLTGICIGHRFPTQELPVLWSIVRSRGFTPSVYRIERHPHTYSLLARRTPLA